MCLRRLVLTAALGAVALPVHAQQEPPQQGEQEPQPDLRQQVARLRVSAASAEVEGDVTTAAQQYQRLVELEPDNWKWYVRAADNLGELGRANDALDVLDRAAARFPDVADVKAMQAKLFHLKADRLRAAGVVDAQLVFLYEDARRTAERVLEMQRGHVEAQLLIASASFQLGDVDRALEVARGVTETRPDRYGGHAMVGRVLFQQFVTARQADEADRAATLGQQATAAFERAAEADDSRSFPLVKLGDLAAWAGDMDAALDRYRTALGLDPNSQIDHDWLRSAVAADQRRALYHDARTAYAERAGQDSRGAGLLRWYEAQADFDAREWEAAATGFRAALEQVPDHQDTYWWLMQSLFWSGDNDAAAEVAVQFAERSPRRFADMIRDDDDTVSTLVGLAADAYRAGRVGDSRELNQVIAYARQTADAWNNYAFLCRETRAYEESLSAYENALRIEPDSPQLLNDAGVILQYHLRGDEHRAQARAYYERAIALAEQQIAGGELEGDALQRAQTALRDARNNLRALDRGRRRR